MSAVSFGLYDVLIRPVSTEKSALMEGQSEYAFFVSRASNKADIKKAVEVMFNVKVERVRTLILKGKSKRSGRRIGFRQDRKKAYVRLVSGQVIEFDKA